MGRGAQTVRRPVCARSARYCIGVCASTEPSLEAHLFGSGRCGLRKDKLNMPAVMVMGLVVLVTLAAWSDLRSRRIPNSITVTGAAVGLLLHVFYGSVS